MGKWNRFQYDINKERISRENLGHNLTTQEVITTELHFEIDQYNPSKDRYKQRIQELTKKYSKNIKI